MAMKKSKKSQDQQIVEGRVRRTAVATAEKIQFLAEMRRWVIFIE